MKENTNKRERRTKEEMDAFISQIKELASQGLTLQEIADKLGEKYKTIHKYSCKYKIEILCNLHRTKAQTKKLINQIKELALQGLTRKEIAEKLNISYRYIRLICQHNNIKVSSQKRQKEEMEVFVSQIKELASQGLTLQEIADRLGEKYMNIQKTCKQYNIESINKRECRTKEEMDAFISQIKELASQGLTLQEIADKLGEKYKTIHKICERHNIVIIKRKEYERSEESKNKESQIRELASQGLTYLEIADRLGETCKSIRSFCKRHNINVCSRYQYSYEAQLAGKIRRLAKKHTRKEIAEILEISYSTVKNYCRNYNITPVANAKEADIAKQIRKLAKRNNRKEIAEILNISPQTVTNYGHKYKIESLCNLRRNKEQMDEFISQINDLAQQGLTYREIADNLNTTYGIIKETCQYHNIVTNKEYRTKEEVKELINQIKELASQGLSRKEITEKLNISYEYTKSICQRNNIKVSSRRRQKEEMEAFIDQIKELASQGLSRKEIAEKLDTSYDSVKQTCIHHNIQVKKSGR